MCTRRPSLKIIAIHVSSCLALISCPQPPGPPGGDSPGSATVDLGKEAVPQFPEKAPAATGLLTSGKPQQTFERRADSYFTSHPTARIYIQLDKPLYQPGETIWLRSLVLATRTFSSKAGQSGITYELINPKGSTVIKKRVLQHAGIATNDFVIPDGVQGGEYSIRVTPDAGESEKRPVIVSVYQAPRFKKKMDFLRKAYGAGDTVAATIEVKRATGEPFANRELISVLTLDGVELPRTKARTDDKGAAVVQIVLPDKIDRGDGILTLLVKDSGITESITKRVPIIVNKLKLSFFPEGGDLIEGLRSRIYFYAQNMIDKPADIEAKVVDDQGQTVATLRSYHDGMGRFAMTPATGHRYHVEIIKPVGVVERYALPNSRAQGCTLRTYDDPKGEAKTLRMAVNCTQQRTVLVNAMIREQRLGTATLKVEPGKPSVVHLPLSRTNMQGVVRVTLLTDQHEALAERLTYRGWHKDLKIKITPDKKSYSPRDLVTLKIETRDLAGEPVAANLAMAVVDDTVLSFADDKTAHLLTHMLLEREVPGKIEEPNFYFKTDKPKAPLALEMLLGTRGWRRFEWRQVMAPPAQHVATTVDMDSIGRGEAPMGLLEEIGIVNDSRDGTQGQGLQERSPARTHRDTERAKPSARAVARSRRTARIRQEIALSGPLGSAGENQGASSDAFEGQGPLGGGRGSSSSLFGEGGLGDMRGIAQGRGMGTRSSSGVGSRARRAKIVVSQGKPTIRGSLDKNTIRRVMRRNHVRVKACYEKELNRDPKVQGRLTINFVIGPKGRVTDSQVHSSSVENQPLQDCVQRAIRRYRFPTPKGGDVVDVSFPFVFRYDGPKSQGSRDWQPSAPTSRYTARPATTWAKVRVFAVPPHVANYSGPRRDFRETLYWNPAVETDASGTATVQFVLSDAVTTFRVTSEGVATTGLAGRDETVLSSKLPFFMEIKLPLEVSAGDLMNLPLTIKNESDKTLSVTVGSSFGDLLKLLEQVIPGTIELAPHSGRTLGYPVEVIGQRGETEVLFTAQAQGLKDEFKRSIKVVPLGFPRELSFAGMLKDKVSHHVDLQGAREGSVMATATLYPTPIASMLSGVASILREPHGCFEQASSANYPNIMALRYLQERRVADPALLKQTSGMLARGYLKTVGYETSSQGFEWFGKAPGHEALTAYGLMQFTDMQRVYGDVDPAMLQRTRGWLLGRRDGKGGFVRDTRAKGSYGRASEQVTNAYIVYALTEAGVTGLGRELDAVSATARSSEDPYVVALTTHSQLKVNRQSVTGQTLARHLAALQLKSGKFAGTTHSVTRSGGHSLAVETTALAVLALLKSGQHLAPVKKAVRWLMRARRGRGSFGSTQATILALKALAEYHRITHRQPAPGSFALQVNGDENDRFDFGPGRRRAIHMEVPGLQVGDNTVELTLGSRRPIELPYGLSIEYRTNDPQTSPEVQLNLSTVASKTQVKMGETVRITTTLNSISERGLPMTLVRLGIPGGLTYQTWQLKELVEKKTIDFYETRAREVIFYFRGLPPKAHKEIAVDLVATVPGTYTAPASSSYLYYTSEHKAWAAPLRITVALSD